MSSETPSNMSITSDVPISDELSQTNLHDGALAADMAHLTVSDEKAVEIKTGASGSYSGKSKDGEGYSPSSRRYTPPFVRNGIRSQSEDPFQPTPRNRTHSGPITTPKSSRIMSDNWRSGSSGSSAGDASYSPLEAKSQRKSRQLLFGVQEHVSETAGSNLTGYTLIKAEDAQAIYPPACCVFVANLLQSESEDTLQMAVTQVFREFGPVFVKIRRDNKQMPFAFCQYTKPEHAERAIQEGRGRMIKGRPCRCEKAKAHRLFHVERKYGPVITPDEARQLLDTFGKIEYCRMATHVERTALNLNEGVIVQFEMYDEGQNAHSAFRNHDIYKVQAIAGLGSPARNTDVRSPTGVDTAARAYLARYEVDRRSIFVGNLPAGTTEDQIRSLFEQYGSIEDIIIRETVSKFESQEKFCFAFVEFRTVISVGNAITAKNGFTLGGRALRVMQKDSDGASTRNRVRPHATTGPSAAYQSPAPRRIEAQVSPMSSPPVYGSPYGYPYSPYYSYTPSPYISDGQSYYPTAPYSPAYYTYAASPSYGPRTSAPADVAASSSPHPGYYGYSAYQYTPAPYWSAPAQGMEQQTSSPATYYPPTYSPPMETTGGPDERVVTPTPTGHTLVIDAPVETQ